MNDTPIDLFGKSFDCECGRRHSLVPRRIVYGESALAELPTLCAPDLPARRITVLSDTRTRAAAGLAAAEALRSAGFDVSELVAEDPPGGSPVCDDVTKNALAARLPATDVIVAVGSGVINDLGKWLAHEASLPYVAVATAASMNGYTSANVAPTVGGLKTLLRAAPPVAVAADPRVLAQAPYELTAAGLGDVLAKSVSSADWRMNNLLFGDYYCERSVALVAEIEPLYLDRPADIRGRAPAAMKALFDALLLTGAAMTMAGTSAPASGGEHMISHCLDMMSSLDNRGHDLHGRQVGVGTIIAAEVYQRVLALKSPQFVDGAGSVDTAFWGSLAGAMTAEYDQKRPRIELAADKLRRGGEWDNLRAALANMPHKPGRIRDCLSAAGAACTAADIGCSRQRLLTAFAHAHEIRSRYTILDLARLVGVLPAAAEEIVDRYT